MNYYKDQFGIHHEIHDLDYFFECHEELFIRPCTYIEFCEGNK